MASADWFLAKTQRFSLCSSHKTPVDTGSVLASQSKSVLRSISARCASRCSLRNNGSSILWWAGLQWCLHMDPSEVEFLAEKELVTITPNFSESRMCLISGDFGPFNPSMRTEVPIWLAVNLRQRHKCRIEPPDWLSVGMLTDIKVAETEAAVFTKMPSAHYREVADLILNNAAEDVPRADEVRALVKDVWDLRMAKLRKSVDHMITKQETHGKLNNLTVMEINTVRPFLTQALDHAHILRTQASQFNTAGSASNIY